MPGSPTSLENPDLREQKKNSKKIEQSLAQDGAAEQRVIKLLLLGTGDSGKSTIMKQVGRSTLERFALLLNNKKL